MLGEHTKEIVKIQHIRKNNMDLKEGDKYIHFTNRGGINKGEVKSCGSHTVIDSFNCVTYKKYHIFNTKGIMLELDGSDGKIYKVVNELTPEQGKNVLDFMEKAQEMKSSYQELHRNGVEL